jgi:hypothetical protein
MSLMNRLRLLQPLPPLPLFGHKIQDPFPVTQTVVKIRPNVLRHNTPHPLAAASRTVTMHITIDAANVTPLRQLAVRVCGDSLSSIRVQPIAHAKRMNVWLCLKAEALDTVMSTIMRTLPCAQFGRFNAI